MVALIAYQPLNDRLIHSPLQFPSANTEYVILEAPVRIHNSTVGLFRLISMHTLSDIKNYIIDYGLIEVAGTSVA